MSFGDAYKNKTVLVTGHTGFKGSWLSEWLLLLGARVVGYSRDVPTAPSHFDAIQLGERLSADIRKDVRSLNDLKSSIAEHRPDFIFHLAAQPLVRRGYAAPHETLESNVMGSLNVLEAVRLLNHPCVVVMITTDKVYDNAEWVHSYRETDPLGGHDPYSASKACAEILISSYRRSFFDCGPGSTHATIGVATARGGNVLGGGDWAEDRIVPDCIRSLAQSRPVAIRNRLATRPWQHVLELAGAYLHLGAEISRAMAAGDQIRQQAVCTSFNFGPNLSSNRTVGDLVQEVFKSWPGTSLDLTDPHAAHEAGRLNLSIDKAHHILGWTPRWSFEETVAKTVEWYRSYYESPESVRDMTRQQVLSYQAALGKAP